MAAAPSTDSVAPRCLFWFPVGHTAQNWVQLSLPPGLVPGFAGTVAFMLWHAGVCVCVCSPQVLIYRTIFLCVSGLARLSQLKELIRPEKVQAGPRQSVSSFQAASFPASSQRCR